MDIVTKKREKELKREQKAISDALAEQNRHLSARTKALRNMRGGTTSATGGSTAGAGSA